MASLTFVVGSVVATPGTSPPTLNEKVTSMSGNDLAGGAIKTLDLGTDAELVGLTFDRPAEVIFKLRALRSDGSWSEWMNMDADGVEAPDGDTAEASDHGSAGPVYVGQDIHKVQVQADNAADIGDIAVHAVNSEPETGASGASALGFGASTAGAAAGKPWMTLRAGWGADESFRHYAAGCSGTPSYLSSIKIGAVHHTVSVNDYTQAQSASVVRGIYYYHTHSEGYCDIAYNFLVDRFGTIYEGRAGGVDRFVLGGHTSGFNSYSTGVSMIGNYDIAPPPDASYQSVRRIMAYKLGQAGIDPHGRSTVVVKTNSSARWPTGTTVTLPNLEGHRDSNTTACPGIYMYNQLPRLRDDVANDIRGGTAPPPPPPPGSTLGQRIPVACDYDRDGDTDFGIFKDGAWAVRFTADSGPGHISFLYGAPGDVPVCGDWDGNGTPTPGIFRNGTWYLRNTVTSGVADFTYQYGIAGDRPVVGDWDNSNRDQLGVFRAGKWFLKTGALTGTNLGNASLAFVYGMGSDVPVVGDWDGNGTDTPAAYRNGVVYERNSNSTGIADRNFAFGAAGDRPVSGDWNRDNIDTLGVLRGTQWFLVDVNANAVASAAFTF